MAPIQTLPCPLPRACEECGQMFTPLDRRRWQTRVCSLKCQRSHFLNTDDNANLGRRSAEKISLTLRARFSGPRKSPYKQVVMGKPLHIRVAEQKLGRPLIPGETVHHKDTDPWNNDPENILVLASQSEHARTHWGGYRECAESDCEKRPWGFSAYCHLHHKEHKRP